MAPALTVGVYLITDESRGKSVQARLPTHVWMPTSDQGVRKLPCGRWWDAVRVPEHRARHVLTRLAYGSAVIHDQAAGLYTWLVAPGGAGGWDQVALGVLVPPPGHVIAVPPGEWQAGPGTRWLVPPGNTLTDADRLLEALRATPL
ncbi:hypothetical protein [Streptomyces specialis]|uniref:hypothetical protein n=1 Tax=Streptomyces specialis TaxID=498367 RepID=UPI00073EC1FC|nr:hypothetical protein [Streptomyces specialis]